MRGFGIPSTDDSDDLMADYLAHRRSLALPTEIWTQIESGENPIRAIRGYRKMTQATLAEAAGINRVTLSKIESGRAHPSGETLKAIAAALKCAMDDLV